MARNRCWPGVFINWRRRRELARDLYSCQLTNMVVEVYGTSAVTADQSALMLVARITLPHFSVSWAINLPKSAGDSTNGVPPKSASRAFNLGSARPALISLLSLSMTSTGVPFGAPTPYHAVTS